MPTQIGENRAKKMLKANELVLCMGVNQLRTPNIAMIAAACGFDAVYIDLEHNPTSLETAAAVCVAALGMGITPIARVNSHDPHDATRILDCGAQGVMVPHIQNAGEARATVEACLYAPKGHRSAFGSGPQLGYAAIPQAEVCKVLNEQTLLMAMIETPEAVENADAIAAVDGIDVLHIGASDLSTEMGIPGQYTHERMRAAFEAVARAAKGHDKAMGVGGVRQDFEFQSWLLRLGVRYLTRGSDVGYILSAGRADVKQLRELKFVGSLRISCRVCRSGREGEVFLSWPNISACIMSAEWQTDRYNTKGEKTMKAFLRLLALGAGASALLMPAEATRAQLLIIGNDEKVSFDENTGKTITHPSGKDTVSIIDIADPAKPKIVVNLPLMNTITGPPVNLAITPDQHLALVANSLDWVKDGDAWKGVPDNKIYVIDLTASPPRQIGTVEAGKQASGMAINRTGTLALVANRAEDSVTVLAIDGKNVKSVGTVSVATQPTAAVATPPAALPAAVAITPDGKRALVVKSGANRVGLLEIDGQKVSYTQVDGKNYDMATGLNPLNVQITPDGNLAIVNNIGGGQDGQVDTVGVIDLEASPPRVIDQVVVGDGPEGLAMSPAGGYAASVILNGTGGTPKNAFYRHEHSYVSLLKIEGKTVRNVGRLAVGDLAEGVAFSPDGRFVFVGNFVDGNMDILKLDGDILTMVASFALPGHPASMRGSTP